MTQFWHPTGIAGPAAWIASSLRQTRQGPGGLHLSCLTAPDARDPWIMLGGFLVADSCRAALALREALSQNAPGGAGGGCPRPGCRPADGRGGLLRRDHMLLSVPGEPGASCMATRMTRSAA